MLPPDNASTCLTALDPFAEYERRRAERAARSAKLGARYRAWFGARTVAVVIVVSLVWLGEKERLLPLLLVLPILAVVSAILEMNRAYRAWVRALRALRFYERRLANLEERWAGSSESGSRFLDDAHPCARDLDLFGPGSLFERLHLTGTPLGEETLASWLRTSAGAEEVRARQAAVIELRDLLDLREDIAMLGQQAPTPLDASILTRWAALPVAQAAPWARPAAAALAALTALAAVSFVLGFSAIPLLAMLALSCAVALRMRSRRALGALPTTAADLRPLVAILARLERERFFSGRLCRIQATLAAARPLAGLVCILGAQPIARLAFPALGTTQLSLALDAWRIRHGTELASWLAALGEIEALHALAAYAFESPADPFPEVVDEGPCFEADGLGHPLLPTGRCVRNSLCLDPVQRLLIVSGSNMSGKSTLLRTVGVNAVLALAGGPVRATRLRLAPLTLGATLRLQDSLLEGRSRFFAEVLRVRQILDLARTHPPVLFLLDELFSGTNSDDRRQGAEAVLRRLLDAGALGLITTHDLALTHLAYVLAPAAVNVHFADQFKGGAMTFDYRMRTGVVANGNGLALMRAVGIDI